MRGAMRALTVSRLSILGECCMIDVVCLDKLEPNVGDGLEPVEMPGVQPSARRLTSTTAYFYFCTTFLYCYFTST